MGCSSHGVIGEIFCLRGKLPIYSALRTGVGGIAGNASGTCKKNGGKG